MTNIIFGQASDAHKSSQVVFKTRKSYICLTQIRRCKPISNSIKNKTICNCKNNVRKELGVFEPIIRISELFPEVPLVLYKNSAITPKKLDLIDKYNLNLEIAEREFCSKAKEMNIYDSLTWREYYTLKMFNKLFSKRISDKKISIKKSKVYHHRSIKYIPESEFFDFFNKMSYKVSKKFKIHSILVSDCSTTLNFSKKSKRNIVSYIIYFYTGKNIVMQIEATTLSRKENYHMFKILILPLQGPKKVIVGGNYN